MYLLCLLTIIAHLLQYLQLISIDVQLEAAAAAPKVKDILCDDKVKPCLFIHTKTVWSFIRSVQCSYIYIMFMMVAADVVWLPCQDACWFSQYCLLHSADLYMGLQPIQCSYIGKFGVRSFPMKFFTYEIHMWRVMLNHKNSLF